MLIALPGSIFKKLRRPLPPDQRGVDLLTANLTRKQRQQYVNNGYFDVIGGHSGKRYRIWHCFQQNIEELDAPRSRPRIWCFHPQSLVLGDVMLAQKTALELFETDAMRIAHVYWDFALNVGPRSRRAREDYLRTLRLPWRRRVGQAALRIARAARRSTARGTDVSARDLYRAARLCAFAAAFSCVPAFMLF
jgi:hypothetical protein